MTPLAIEILIGVLVVTLAVATTMAAIVGLAGLSGVARLIRCEHCNRFALRTGNVRPTSCMNCRHERVLHPIAVRHRRWAGQVADGHAPRHA